jgi:hypothetical protein
VDNSIPPPSLAIQPLQEYYWIIRSCIVSIAGEMRVIYKPCASRLEDEAVVCAAEHT